MTANVEPSPIMIKSTAERHELGELGTDSAKCYTKNLKDTQIHKILWPNPCFRWRSGARQHRIRGGNFKSKKNGLHTLFWHTSWQLVAHVLTASTEHEGAGRDKAASGVHSQGAYMREGTKPFPGPLLS